MGPALALLGATLVSALGSQLTAIAPPWFVLLTTGSAPQTGLTGTFMALPHFVSGVLAGAVVDRLGYRKVSVAGDLVSGCGISGGAINPLLVAVRHERIPFELRGRVFATFTAIAQIAQPLGMAVGGLAIDGLGF